jgi:hypothetical protein
MSAVEVADGRPDPLVPRVDAELEQRPGHPGAGEVPGGQHLEAVDADRPPDLLVAAVPGLVEQPAGRRLQLLGRRPHPAVGGPPAVAEGQHGPGGVGRRRLRLGVLGRLGVGRPVQDPALAVADGGVLQGPYQPSQQLRVGGEGREGGDRQGQAEHVRPERPVVVGLEEPLEQPARLPRPGPVVPLAQGQQHPGVASGRPVGSCDWQCQVPSVSRRRQRLSTSSSPRNRLKRELTMLMIRRPKAVPRTVMGGRPRWWFQPLAPVVSSTRIASIIEAVVCWKSADRSMRSEGRRCGPGGTRGCGPA